MKKPGAKSDMEAVILAGGKGTRLRPYTTTLPKPLVPVGEQPILSIVLEQLRRAGCRKVTLAVNHMADLIMSFFGDGRKMGIQIEYSVEDQPLGTVAPLKLLTNLPEHFLVMNGDVLSDLNYRALFDQHRRSNKLLTVGTYSRKMMVDFGVLTLSANGRLKQFSEKPTYEYLVSTGVYVFSRNVLELVPAGRPFGFDNLMLKMLETGHEVQTFRHNGYWLDLGRPEDYDKANDDYQKMDTLRLGATA